MGLFSMELLLVAAKPVKNSLEKVQQNANFFLTEVTQQLTQGGMPEGQYVLYHFESKHGRLLCPPSTRFWKAIGLGLIKFFGGKIDLNDCDEIDVDKVARKRYRNNPEDGEEWDRFQRRILNLKPLEL